MKTVYTGEKDARSFKDVLGGTIAWLLDNDPDVIYLDADLMRCIGTYDYFKKHPDRAVNCGVAEANMAGVAAATIPPPPTKATCICTSCPAIPA